MEENIKQISYLDLNIKNEHGTVEIDIYKKPIATDITSIKQHFMPYSKTG
jgi:hypothetical protein